MQLKILRLFEGLVIVGLCLFSISCENFEPTKPITAAQSLLDAPVNVAAKVDDGAITLSWSHKDSSTISSYNVYRKTDNNDSFALISTDLSKTYRDINVTNNALYYYQVAAVANDNTIGKRSEIISATPAVFSIVIGGGVQYTRNRTVQIAVTAPPNTSLMMFANDSTFLAGQWENYAVNRSWQLAAGDGPKTVYAKFRSAGGNEILKPVSASLVLDSQARIISLVEGSNGATLLSGNILHITMATTDSSGLAFVDIYEPGTTAADKQARNIKLYDDGTHGDKVKNDKVYEVDYFIRDELDIHAGIIEGSFSDLAGNQAIALKTRTTVDINPQPDQPILLSVVNPDQSSSSLGQSWTQNNDSDFAFYKIMRSKTPVVDLNSDFVTEIRTANTTTYLDTGLDPNTLYYYKIYVFDNNGLSNSSGILSGQTAVNARPADVILSEPTGDASGISLSWSSSLEDDFATYRLFRSTTATIDTTTTPVTVLSSRNVLSYKDRNAVAGTLYYYQIYIYDLFGLASKGSNVVQGKRN